MFSAVSKLYHYLWPADSDGSIPNDDGQASDVEEEEVSGGTPNLHREKLLHKEFTGRLTQLFGEYGMIDEEIYFSLDIVIGRVRPYINSRVHVRASRQTEYDGWRADSVVVLEEDDTDWDKEASQVKGNNISNQEIIRETIVGMVTKTSKDEGLVNDITPFQFCNLLYGYYPYPGDWVTADVITNKTTNTSHAENVRPLREKTFEDQVSSVQQGFGYTVGDIYFTFSACSSGYRPSRGDQVTGKAIECSRGKCSWRAVQLTWARRPREDFNHVLRPLSLKLPTQGQFLQQLLQDKEGIVISQKLDFGCLPQGQRKHISAHVRNGGGKCRTFLRCTLKGGIQSQLTVLGAKLLQENPRKSVLSSSETSVLEGKQEKIALYPGMTLYVNITCEAREYGEEQQLLVFEFEGFKIGRQVRVLVTDPTLDPTTPYQKWAGSSQQRATIGRGTDEGWIVPGERPQRGRRPLRLPNKLPQYPVPTMLRNCVLDRDDLVYQVPALGEPLSVENYTERFSALLHLEEIQMEIDIRQFDLERVCLRRCGEFLALEVPGLAEGRPSVLVGDRIMVCEPGASSSDGPQYEGYVHEVRKDEVLLKFHSDFHLSYQGQDCDVVFTFNRTPMRRAHQVVNFAPKIGTEVLFPTQLVPKPRQTTTTSVTSPTARHATIVPVTSVLKGNSPRGMKLPLPSKSGANKFYNGTLNPRQKAAVQRILGGQSRPIPYILFGPPGTGKTVTLVEAILQVFHRMPSSRIIACAPSNSAADLLAERLHGSGQIKQGDMTRLNAFNRAEETVPTCLEPYCSVADDLELVVRHRIVVCTCVMAGTLYSLGLKPGHFTHTFVDEAGQATEPECLIPVGLVVGSEGQVVLAGDPYQLGPVLRSKEAKLYGLDLSLLERLTQRSLYSRDENRFADHGSYDPLLVTKLVENYRCHSVLIDLPSQLFYDNELLVSGDPAVIQCLCHWPMLPNKQDCPLIFHGLRGEDMREGDSPSWFNPVEVVQVMKYLQALVNNTTHTLTFDDIGIITPYRKQVEKIRLLMNKLGMEQVKVGSVEEFQGQERLVIIISMVRSNEDYVGSDVHHNLGFLSNPKRFNVAITRAQALLIIVGNPFVLAQDEHWLALLKYCIEREAYIGCDLEGLVGMTNATSVYSCNTGEQDESDIHKEANSDYNCDKEEQGVFTSKQVLECHRNSDIVSFSEPEMDQIQERKETLQSKVPETKNKKKENIISGQMKQEMQERPTGEFRLNKESLFDNETNAEDEVPSGSTAPNALTRMETQPSDKASGVSVVSVPVLESAQSILVPETGTDIWNKTVGAASQSVPGGDSELGRKGSVKPHEVLGNQECSAVLHDLSDHVLMHDSISTVTHNTLQGEGVRAGLDTAPLDNDLSSGSDHVCLVDRVQTGIENSPAHVGDSLHAFKDTAGHGYSETRVHNSRFPFLQESLQDDCDLGVGHTINVPGNTGGTESETLCNQPMNAHKLSRCTMTPTVGRARLLALYKDCSPARKQALPRIGRGIKLPRTERHLYSPGGAFVSDSHPAPPSHDAHISSKHSVSPAVDIQVSGNFQVSPPCGSQVSGDGHVTSPSSSQGCMTYLVPSTTGIQQPGSKCRSSQLGATETLCSYHTSDEELNTSFQFSSPPLPSRHIPNMITVKGSPQLPDGDEQSCINVQFADKEEILLVCQNCESISNPKLVSSLQCLWCGGVQSQMTHASSPDNAGRDTQVDLSLTPINRPSSAKGATSVAEGDYHMYSTPNQGYTTTDAGLVHKGDTVLMPNQCHSIGTEAIGSIDVACQEPNEKDVFKDSRYESFEDKYAMLNQNYPVSNARPEVKEHELSPPNSNNVISETSPEGVQNLYWDWEHTAGESQDDQRQTEASNDSWVTYQDKITHHSSTCDDYLIGSIDRDSDVIVESSSEESVDDDDV